jgi:eukaryotic-like serine/threonine-protein kinase
MNKKLFVTVFVFAAVLLLTGCAKGQMPSSWTGVTAGEGFVYLANATNVYAVNLDTGAQVWKFQVKASAYAAPRLTGDGQLIIGGYDHVLYSLNPQSGLASGLGLWPFKGAHDRYIGSPLITNDTIYAPNADYNLYALDLQGQLKWEFKADQALWATPAMDGSNVYFGSLGGKFYSLNAATGAKNWDIKVDTAVLSTPVVKDGVIYVTTFSGNLLALESATGKTIWSKPAADRIWSGPVLEGDLLYFGDISGGLYAYDLKGNLVWQQKLNGGIVGLPAIYNNAIIVGTDAGNIYVISLDGKDIIWQAMVPGEKTGTVHAPPVVAGKLILVAPTDGSNFLVALDGDGLTKWVFNPSK